MINKAMFYDKNQFNEFTLWIKVINEGSKKPPVVKTRNGLSFEVVFKPENKEKNEDAMFHTSEWSHVWNLDGSSVKNNDLDLCYIEYENNPQMFK